MKILGLLFFFLITFLTAVVGSAASVQAGEFYRELNQPAWAPPGWLFGPVWSLLYFMMATAAWLVWLEDDSSQPSRRPALILYCVQLAANALWTWLFFAWRLGALAFAEILLLWMLTAVMTYLFFRIKKIAGILLIPYLAWLTFAAALAFAVWRLNPEFL